MIPWPSVLVVSRIIVMVMTIVPVIIITVTEHKRIPVIMVKSIVHVPPVIVPSVIVPVNERPVESIDSPLIFIPVIVLWNVEVFNVGLKCIFKLVYDHFFLDYSGFSWYVVYFVGYLSFNAYERKKQG